MINYKRIVLLLGLLTGLAVQGYTQDAVNLRLEKKFVKYYNNRKYEKIHELFTADFKREVDEEEIEYFLEYETRYREGKIITATYLRKEKGFHVYLVEFEKRKLELHLASTANGEISGLAFTAPAKSLPKEKTVKESLLSTNILSNRVDSICDSVVRDFYRKNQLAGFSIGIVKEGRSYFYHYGETYKGNHVLPDEYTVYDLGSVSKTFTALLLAMAVEQNLVKPDDDIRKYLTGEYPNLQFKNTPVTLIQLVNHSSGLAPLPYDLKDQPDFNDSDPYKNYSKEMLLNSLKKVKLSDRPGTHVEYSNYAVAVCGMILENIYHKSYEDLVLEYICRPYGMEHTYVNIPDSLRNKMVGCYDEELEQTDDWHLGAITPAGGISSTASDMLQYITVNCEEKTTALKRAHTPSQKESKGRYFGYAWVINDWENGQQLIWHNGGTSGSTSFCGYIKQTGTAVVILNNSGISVDPLAISLLKSLR